MIQSIRTNGVQTCSSVANDEKSDSWFMTSVCFWYLLFHINMCTGTKGCTKELLAVNIPALGGFSLNSEATTKLLYLKFFFFFLNGIFHDISLYQVRPYVGVSCLMTM